MPTLNTSTSIVDLLKSKGMDSSYANRSKLATQYGITNYTGSKEQNTLLLQKVSGAGSPAPAPVETPKQPTVPDYSAVGNIADANKAINSNQKTDIANATKTEDPAIKSSFANVDNILNEILGKTTTVSDTNSPNMTDIMSAVKPTTDKPAVVDLTDTYKGLRTEYGVEGLETQLNTLNAELEALKTAKTARTNAMRSKPVAMNVIEGRVSEAERQENERISAVENSIKTVNDQLTTKYNVVNTLMNLTQTDYTNAVSNYDKQLSTNIQLFNTLRGIDESAKTEKERQQDNARSSLQIVYNTLTSGGSDVSSLPATTKTLLAKLETQAGLPAGFYETLKAKSAKADIVATYNWTDTSGKEYASVLTKDPTTGEIKTNNILLGTAKATGSSDKPTESENKVFYKQSMQAELSKVKDQNGYVTPEQWAKARQNWASNTPYGATDFDEAFRGFIYPARAGEYAGFENYKAGFIKKSAAELQAEGLE